MADLYNLFPSWGESGEYPQSGFFYEGGDQVNEKHMDALWNGVEEHIDNLNTGIRDRVRKLQGDVVLDQGLVASEGSGTREVDVTASSEGAFVDGQFSGSVDADTLTHTANGGASTRTDVVWVDVDGDVGKTEGTDTTSNDRMKIAEVDVATDDTISAVRNHARDHRFLIASEETPETAEPGDLWHDLTDVREKVRQGGDWLTLITEQDNITISGGDGLKNGNTIDLLGGETLSLDIEPSDFAGTNLEDDGNDNLSVIQGDGSELDADTVDGEHASAFADTNHGNEEHSSDFTTLTEVNNSADVPNADFADDADTVDGQHASAFTSQSEFDTHEGSPFAHQSVPIYGDGSDGNYTANGSVPNVINAVEFTTSGTVNVDGYLIVRATERIHITNFIDADGVGGTGGNGATAPEGGGDNGQSGILIPTSGGGSGGDSLHPGGSGGSGDTVPGLPAVERNQYSPFAVFDNFQNGTVPTGGGGGGGAGEADATNDGPGGNGGFPGGGGAGSRYEFGSSSGDGGDGGNGGGFIYLAAPEIVIDSTVSADGQNGQNGQDADAGGGGGGGGSGGIIVISGGTVTGNGNVNANAGSGGSGGSGSEPGGNGADGENGRVIYTGDSL